jgi:hydroxymethylpyrimidine pyrophosphatase-like HAD family hydrolase
MYVIGYNGSMIICDIDNTLLRNGTQPIKKTIDYVNSLHTKIVIVTGREKSQLSETVRALNAAGVKYSKIMMNPYSYKQSNKWKAEVAEKLKGATLAIDDNAGARAAYSKAGIKAIHPDNVPDMEKFWTVFEDNSGY